MKQKIFLDFDQTIVASIKRFCEAYNETFYFHSKFKKAEWWETSVYDFSDTCPLIESARQIFDFPIFFNGLELINANTYEVLERLCEQYEVHIVSIGTFKNLALKSAWINENLPCVDYAELLNTHSNVMNKSIINMSGGILIDDVSSNLTSSNAEYKFTFGDEYEWNKDSKYERLFNWTDIENKLLVG